MDGTVLGCQWFVDKWPIRILSLLLTASCLLLTAHCVLMDALMVAALELPRKLMGTLLIWADRGKTVIRIVPLVIRIIDPVIRHQNVKKAAHQDSLSIRFRRSLVLNDLKDSTDDRT